MLGMRPDSNSQTDRPLIQRSVDMVVESFRSYAKLISDKKEIYYVSSPPLVDGSEHHFTCHTRTLGLCNTGKAAKI